MRALAPRQRDGTQSCSAAIGHLRPSAGTRRAAAARHRAVALHHPGCTARRLRGARAGALRERRRRCRRRGPGHPRAGAAAPLLAAGDALLQGGRRREAPVRPAPRARPRAEQHLGHLQLRRPRLLQRFERQGPGGLRGEDALLRRRPRRGDAAHRALQVPAPAARAQLARVDDDGARAPVLQRPGLLQGRARPRHRQPGPAPDGGRDGLHEGVARLLHHADDGRDRPRVLLRHPLQHLPEPVLRHLRLRRRRVLHDGPAREDARGPERGAAAARGGPAVLARAAPGERRVHRVLPSEEGTFSLHGPGLSSWGPVGSTRAPSAPLGYAPARAVWIGRRGRAVRSLRT